MRTFYIFDDNLTTLEDFREVAAELGVEDDLKECSDEMASLETIENYAPSDEEPIFVVDLNIDTRESGIRILQAIRRKDGLKKSPVIVITSSQEQDTINKCYEKGANAFYRKSQTPDQFRSDVASLMRFWKAASVHDHGRIVEG